MTAAEESSSKRIDYIDIAKGIAIISIILGHLSVASINRVVYTFHVPIFYFITGYFINDKKSVSVFIKDRAKKLLIPYYISCVIMIILATIEGALAGDALLYLQAWTYAALYASGDTYTEPFYIRAIGAIWFLWALFWGSVFFRITLKYKSEVRAGTIALLFLLGYFSRSLFWFPLSIQAGACAALFIYMGYLLRESQLKINELPKEVKLFGMGFAFATWICFIKDYQPFCLVHCGVGRGIVDIFGCMCACACVMIISYIIDRKTKYLGKFLAYIGYISLLVLCVHIVELNLFPWLRFVYAVSPQHPLLVAIIGKLVINILVSWKLSKNDYIRKLFGF